MQQYLRMILVTMVWWWSTCFMGHLRTSFSNMTYDAELLGCSTVYLHFHLLIQSKTVKSRKVTKFMQFRVHVFQVWKVLGWGLVTISHRTSCGKQIAMATNSDMFYLRRKYLKNVVVRSVAWFTENTTMFNTIMCLCSCVKPVFVDSYSLLLTVHLLFYQTNPWIHIHGKLWKQFAMFCTKPDSEPMILQCRWLIPLILKLLKATRPALLCCCCLWSWRCASLQLNLAYKPINI